MKRSRTNQRTLRFENLENRELMNAAGWTPSTLETQAAEQSQAAVSLADATVASTSATNLPFGSVVADRIANRGEIDKFKFTVTAGTMVQLAVTGTNAAGFVAYADVLDPSGNKLLTVKAGEFRNFPCHTGGTYKIQVHDQKLTKTGGYTLGLERLSAPYSNDQQPIAFGAIVDGTIGQPLQRNQYTFTVTAGTQVQLAVTGTSANGFVAWADVYDPNGNKLFTVKAGEIRNCPFRTGGTYLIQVQDWLLTKTGGYTLGLERLSAPYSDDQQPIGFGPIVGGTIGKPIQRNQYTFTVTAGTQVQLAVTGTNGNGFVAWADVYDQNGNKLFTVKAGEFRNCPFRTGGTYLIQVQDQYLTKTGGYTLGLERLSAPFSDDQQPIGFGTIVAGTISAPIQRNQYTFTVSAGTQVQLAVTGTNANGFVAWADVYDQNGNKQFTVRAGELRSFQFLKGGTYMIQVQDWLLTKTGGYTLGLKRI